MQVEEEGGRLPLTCEVPDLETTAWGKREGASPVKREEAVVAGVAVEVCVDDGESAPVDFWLLSAPCLVSAPLVCALLSCPKKAPPNLRMCLQISSVICICWICLCCRTLSSSKSTAKVGGTCICPCSPGEAEACRSPGLELSW